MNTVRKFILIQSEYDEGYDREIGFHSNYDGNRDGKLKPGKNVLAIDLGFVNYREPTMNQGRIHPLCIKLKDSIHFIESHGPNNHLNCTKQYSVRKMNNHVSELHARTIYQYFEHGESKDIGEIYNQLQKDHNN